MRFLCFGGVLSGVVGVVLLLTAFGREHRDLQRLYLLTAGWLGLACGALLVIAAIALRLRRKIPSQIEDAADPASPAHKV